MYQRDLYHTEGAVSVPLCPNPLFLPSPQLVSRKNNFGQKAKFKQSYSQLLRKNIEQKRSKSWSPIFQIPVATEAGEEGKLAIHKLPKLGRPFAQHKKPKAEMSNAQPRSLTTLQKQ